MSILNHNVGFLKEKCIRVEFYSIKNMIVEFYSIKKKVSFQTSTYFYIFLLNVNFNEFIIRFFFKFFIIFFILAKFQENLRSIVM